MRILVTGGAGYVGSVLIPRLLVRGHEVRVVDLGYFSLAHLRGMRPEPEIIREDVRSMIVDPGVCARLVEGVDCIIHLAAISNDPSAELQPELTHQTNFEATVALAHAAKERLIRFLFSSSCSIYGAREGELSEDAPTNPLTVYAISKTRAEEALEEMADSTWRPVVLRNGTLFGYSPRMRFDLVVNIFSLTSLLHGEIRVFGGGQQWRPFLHVGDCARAFVFFAEKTKCSHLRYNVAHENLRIIDLVQIFQQIKPGLKITEVPTENADIRNYRVSTRRIRDEGFDTQIGVRLGAEEMMNAIVAGEVRDPESLFYQNAKWLKELTTRIDASDHRGLFDLMESFSRLRRTNQV